MWERQIEEVVLAFGFSFWSIALSLPPNLSEAFYADAVRRVNLLTLAFALCFPAFERLRSTRSLA